MENNQTFQTIYGNLVLGLIVIVLTFCVIFRDARLKELEANLTQKKEDVERLQTERTDLIAKVSYHKVNAVVPLFSGHPLQNGQLDGFHAKYSSHIFTVR